jgi:glycosyltransferase involved in cell wall biosynthesis
MWEGMPLALIEAQATGLPAVVSDVVGCRDVVRDGITGFVCGTMDEVVERVKLLIVDTELRKKMGANARSMALKRFSSERMHRESLAVYGY